MSFDSPDDRYASIARELSAQPGVAATLSTATAAALNLVSGCDHAGITLVRRGAQVETVAPTHEAAVQADRWQHEMGEGPCLQSVSEQETVYSRDLLDESRWPHWAPRVASELSIMSVLAIQLFVGSSSIGALNLYSTRRDAFDLADRVTATALAAHVAVAMTAAQAQENLDSALVNRTVIGQAEGMLMQALTISPSQAFAVLTRLSQTSHTKLHLIAADIVKNGIRAELFD